MPLWPDACGNASSTRFGMIDEQSASGPLNECSDGVDPISRA
jgi:hypothetical protein